MCKIICLILFYYSIMIRNKSINVLIVFSLKFTITKLLIFTKTVFFHELVFFTCKILCFRLTISSTLLETPLMTICFSLWLVLAPFFKCINRRFAASIDYVGLEAKPWSQRQCRPFMMGQLVTLHSAQTVGLHFQEVLSDASYK